MKDSKDNKDDFWKELMGENGNSDEKKTSSDEKTDDLNFLIEYLNRDGDVLGTEKLDGKRSSDDDFWAEFGKELSNEKKTEDSKPFSQNIQPAQKPIQQNPQQAPKPAQQNPQQTSKPAQQNTRPPEPPVKKPVQQNPQQIQRPAGQEPQPPQRPPHQFNAIPQERDNVPSKNPPQPVRRPDYTEKSIEDLTGPKDFEVDFDFDEEYEDVHEKVIKRGRSKRTGCLSGLLYFVFIICISIVIACFGWMSAVDVLGLGEEDQEVAVTVTKDMMTTENQEDEDGNSTTVDVADIDAVAEMLYNEGLIKYKWLFGLFSSFSHAKDKIQAGTYILNMNFDYRALVNGMTKSGGELVTTDVTIPEGYNSYQIVSLLDSEGVCDADDLWDAMANYEFDYDFLDDSTLGDKLRLEGYLFPDTYTFYVGDSASRVIGKLLTNFKNKWTEDMQEQADELGYSQYEILTIASMIEKEAGADSERATIASVIYNRLNSDTTGKLLQIDATIYYAIADTEDEFSTDFDSPYNTYKYPGLTPGPIANPGIASIKAALDPESTNYYYYALGTDNLHRFFATYEEHQAFIASDEYGG